MLTLCGDRDLFEQFEERHTCVSSMASEFRTWGECISSPVYV